MRCSPEGEAELELVVRHFKQGACLHPVQGEGTPLLDQGGKFCPDDVGGHCSPGCPRWLRWWCLPLQRLGEGVGGAGAGRGGAGSTAATVRAGGRGWGRLGCWLRGGLQAWLLAQDAGASATRRTLSNMHQQLGEERVPVGLALAVKRCLGRHRVPR